MDHLSRVMLLFSEITADRDIARLGAPYSYYYSDEIKSNILAENVIEIDIKSAFPTICKIYFGKDHQFVKNIFEINDKLKRNISISTTLKEQSELDDGKYLNELNLWSKIIILGYVYSRYNEVVILQFIKDGAIIKGKLKDDISEKENQFLNFIIDNDVEFHEHPLDYYIRFNKTSIIKSPSKIDVKGKYKALPKFIQDIVFPRFFNGDIYDYKLLNSLRQIYSSLYFNILYNSNITDYISDYYSIDGQYLNKHDQFSTLTEICPKMYLINIIYPVLSLFRLKSNS